MSMDIEWDYDKSINVPVPFEGTKEQIMANFKSHNFTWGDDEFDARCSECDCKPSHAAAHYPCGNEPPRKMRYIKDGVIVMERRIDE